MTIFDMQHDQSRMITLLNRFERCNLTHTDESEILTTVYKWMNADLVGVFMMVNYGVDLPIFIEKMEEVIEERTAHTQEA